MNRLRISDDELREHGFSNGDRVTVTWPDGTTETRYVVELRDHGHPVTHQTVRRPKSAARRFRNTATT